MVYSKSHETVLKVFIQEPKKETQGGRGLGHFTLVEISKINFAKGYFCLFCDFYQVIGLLSCSMCHLFSPLLSPPAPLNIIFLLIIFEFHIMYLNYIHFPGFPDSPPPCAPPQKKKRNKEKKYTKSSLCCPYTPSGQPLEK